MVVPPDATTTNTTTTTTTTTNTNSQDAPLTDAQKLEEIKSFAEERGIPFLDPISSKFDQNITKLLDELCEVYLKNESDLDKS